MTRKEAIEFIGKSVKSDVDMALVADAIKALEQEPSSSEIPNKSIEEKCPCYHCEYFEIKGWSHCKIHEDAYGDSRCNDYHKVNQDLAEVKQCSDKSEIPTGSTTKNDLPHCQHTDAEIAKSFIEDVEAVKGQLPCGEQMDFPNTFDEFAKDYGFKDKDEICTNGIELIPVYRVKQWLEHISTTKNDLGVREFEEIVVEYPPEDLCTYPEYKGKPYFSIKYKEGNDCFIGYGTYNPKVFSRYLRDYFMPSVTPVRPKGHWIDHSDEGYVECPKCGSATNCDDNIADLHFCFSCGAKMEGSEEE